MLCGDFMNLTGIVAEYNPFHKGHEYQLKMARENTLCDGIVVVMSGNYVQRGEPAIIEKYRRAEAAIYGGADLVIELPIPFAFQNAEMFANAAIKELKKIPINNLSFGCETTDMDLLENIASIQLNPNFNHEIKKELNKGISYPKALSNVIECILGVEASAFVSSPNNVLAIEYIKSIKRHNLNWNLAPVKRIGKNHNDDVATGCYDSATAIRKNILSGSKEYVNSVTSKSYEMLNDFYNEYECFNSLDNYIEMLYYKIIELGPSGLNCINEVNEGLNNKIYSNLFKYDTIDSYIMSLKSKRYTYSKLRRMLLNIILGITISDIKYFMSTDSNFIKVLAFNDIGRNIIKFAKKNNTSIINRYSDYNKNKLFAENLQLFKISDKTTNFYYLPFKNKKINEEYLKNSSYLNIIPPHRQ